MKILMVTPMLPCPLAGTAQPQVMYAQLAGLAAHHEVTLASFAGPDPADRENLQGLKELGIHVEAVWRCPPSGYGQLKRRARLASYWLRGGRPLKALWFWNPEMQHLLGTLLAKQEFDLLQVEDNVMADYRFRSHAPRVITEHDVRAPGPTEFDIRLLPLEDLGALWKFKSVHQFVSAAERRRWGQYQPTIWKRFDRVQVFTERDATLIRAMAPELAERVFVNPFGITSSAEGDRSLEQDDTVIFFGMFLHPANVDAVLWIAREIMPLLRAARPGIRLIVVGGHAPESVRLLASDRIIVTGHVPSLRPYLERAAVVLVPVRVGGGMRMKVLEAMAAGKAVVTTPLGAEGLSFDRDRPPLAISQDSQGIATVTAELLQSPDARQALGRRAQAYVRQHHSWPAYIRRLEAIHAELQSATTTPVSRG